jgi:hypothetical protein
LSASATNQACAVGRTMARAMASWWNRETIHGRSDLGPYLRIVHGFREVRIDEAGRDYRDAKFVAGFLAQALGDGTRSELRRNLVGSLIKEIFRECFAMMPAGFEPVWSIRG